MKVLDTRIWVMQVKKYLEHFYPQRYILEKEMYINNA